MYSKTIWQKRFAKALACGCLLVASTLPAASAALARLAAEDTKEAAALSGTNETSTISEESGRKITTCVSPGDETKNAPETIPTGPRMTYTVNGFPVTYIETSK